LKSKRGDELGGAVCHYDVHLAVSLAKLAGKIGGFVRGNRSGDTKDNGHQEFRSSGVQEFRLVRSRKLQQERASCD